MGIDIWIPESARETPKFQCRICNDRFVELNSYERHVLKCSRAHETELAEAAEWHEWFHQAPDPEWETYNENYRRQGIDPNVQYSRNRRSNIRRARES